MFQVHKTPSNNHFSGHGEFQCKVSYAEFPLVLMYNKSKGSTQQRTAEHADLTRRQTMYQPSQDQASKGVNLQLDKMWNKSSTLKNKSAPSYLGFKSLIRPCPLVGICILNYFTSYRIEVSCLTFRLCLLYSLFICVEEGVQWGFEAEKREDLELMGLDCIIIKHLYSA